MTDWQPMDTAPRDGTWIQAKIPGYGADNVIAFCSGFTDAGNESVCCWCFMTEQEPPDDWTDGVCWASNADGVPSTLPIWWKLLPASSKVFGKKKLTLVEWVEGENLNLARFKLWWETQQQGDFREAFPSAMPPGEWDEQYRSFGH